YHRLPYGPCGDGCLHSGGPDLVVIARLFQPGALCPHPYRGALLAFRGRGVDRGLLHLLHHAAPGIARMSQAMDPVGAAPETHNVRFLTLLFGAIAAPIFWTGQLILGYVITAHACYPGDQPVQVRFGGALFSTMLAFDSVALTACAASGLVSLRCW